VRVFLDRSRGRLADDEGLRIRLRVDSYPLADLPWEYCYLADADTPPNQRGMEGFLVLDRRISLVRYEISHQGLGQLNPVDTNVRLVAIFSDPANSSYPSLNLDAEQQNLQHALTAIPQITTTFYSTATVETVQNAILGGLDILHFSGHGLPATIANGGAVESGDSIALMGEDGQEVLFPTHQLAMNLKAQGARLVVLGSCEGGRRNGVNAWSGVASTLMRSGIPAIVGMQYKINDKNSLAFNRTFYRALAAHQSIDEAMAAARLVLLTRSSEVDKSDWGVPVLYLRVDEGVLFPGQGQTQISGSGTSGSSISNAPSSQAERVDLRTLHSVMIQAFSSSELEVLCADVEALLNEAGISGQVNLEIVGGVTKTAITLNLIQYLDRRGHLGYLVKAVRSARPGII
jgi:hypothetical protein